MAADPPSDPLTNDDAMSAFERSDRTTADSESVESTEASRGGAAGPTDTTAADGALRMDQRPQHPVVDSLASPQPASSLQSSEGLDSRAGQENVEAATSRSDNRAVDVTVPRETVTSVHGDPGEPDAVSRETAHPHSLPGAEAGHLSPASAEADHSGAPGTEAAGPAVTRPPGPRRAKFDRDEFETPDADEGRPGTSIAPNPAPATSRGLPRPDAPRVFVVANQKGGVGKTTTSVNLAAGLALGGLEVLVVDLDPQGNASTALGIDHAPGTPGTYEVLIEGAAIADHLVLSPEAPRLNVLPATIDLAGAEIQLVSTVARENRLRKALRTHLAQHPVDYVFLDCPPSLGLITLNALVAADEILIPIQCEYYALEGVSQLVRTIDLVKGELNDGLRVSTVLLTMYDARTRLAAQVAEEVRAYFTEETLPTVIPRSVRISEAPSYGQTVLTYHPDSAGAVSYLEAAQELARRGATKEQA